MTEVTDLASLIKSCGENIKYYTRIIRTNKIERASREIELLKEISECLSNNSTILQQNITFNITILAEIRIEGYKNISSYK